MEEEDEGDYRSDGSNLTGERLVTRDSHGYGGSIEGGGTSWSQNGAEDVVGANMPAKERDW